MLNRRHFVYGTALAPFAMRATASVAEELDFDSAAPFRFAENDVVPTLDEYETQIEALTGAANPFKEERALAKALLKDIPTKATPYEVAWRFHLWRANKVPDKTPAELADYSYYSREWPVRGNPVIMGFFDATGLRKISGDTTYWCAAFVSWCIQRSQLGKGINSHGGWPYAEGAASQAYASWGRDVEKDLKEQPRKGDLVVLHHPKKPGTGHVTFYHGPVDDDTFLGLGGNQGAQNERNGGEVNIAAFNRSSTGLKLHSFRRLDALG
ncbi:CHAP domain-containing protein [Mesorhizobium sp. L103C105A0]|uniref:CHAP domain-containing protein n=1 Tax=Mesorhizobium sp. L103C105A0 TaxID=1287074 RepID=UPI0003D017C7|nr:CHAP domain-containing protein [Mesorhizobium sp. L103C105A0]ESZ78667.1 hypothetical protein X726_04135 [Mesorhizobium sp. L103C105A0]